MKRSKIWMVGVFITLINVTVHLSLLPYYGISWDYHYHYYAGRYHMGLSVPSIHDPSPVPFSPPDPRLTTQDPFGPYTQIIPTVFQELLHDQWGILPFDQAYNLPTVLLGALGPTLIYIIMLEWYGWAQACVAALFLSFLPVYIGYLHTDMKDIPNAWFYAASLYTFWRLVKKRTYKELCIATIVYGVAFNVKINAIFIPVICGIYTLWVWFFHRGSHVSRVFAWGVTAPVASLFIWYWFWEHPWEKLMELPRFYSLNTIHMPVLLFGKYYQSGINIPWWYPYVYLGITTPLVILSSVLVGLVVTVKYVWQKHDASVLLVLWFFIPLARYASPHTAAIDGVRHFLEVVFPLCMIGSIGAVHILSYIKKYRYRVSIVVVVFLSLVWSAVFTFPYHTSYFNILVGGISGAQGKFDIDFWGTPQREAMLWLNDHASRDATVHIVMAQSSAALYLRDDLRVLANSMPYDKSQYTVILSRQSFFPLYHIDTYLQEAISTHRVVHTISLHGVPLVWIVQNTREKV